MNNLPKWDKFPRIKNGLFKNGLFKNGLFKNGLFKKFSLIKAFIQILGKLFKLKLNNILRYTLKWLFVDVIYYIKIKENPALSIN